MDKKNRKEIQLQLGDLLLERRELQEKLRDAVPGSAERDDLEKSIVFITDQIQKISEIDNADKEVSIKNKQWASGLGLGTATVAGAIYAERTGILTSKLLPWCKPKGL